MRQISEQLEKVLHIVGEIHRLARETAGAKEKPWEHPRPRGLVAVLGVNILVQGS